MGTKHRGFAALFCASALLAGCDTGFEDPGCTPTNGGVEACGDRIDNDCDGAIDETCETECEDGERRGCGGTPAEMACTETCTGGSWGICTPTDAGGEVCGDGVDNDCDDQTDEGCECDEGDEQFCGGSPEARICARRCVSGAWTGCGPTEGNPGAELCDGLDNDCNGSVDDSPRGCRCDAGEEQWCGGTPEAHTCRQVCEDGSWSDCEPTSGREEEETCGDVEDDDCDGLIDEPEPCTSACGEGEARCEGGSRGECVVPGAECAAGEEESETCTASAWDDCREGTRRRRCGSDCTWGVYSACGDLVGPGPTETADTCYDAYFLGSDPDVTMHLYMHASERSHWFAFHAVDDWSLFTTETIKVDATGLPGDFSLALYFSSCSSSSIANVDVDGAVDEHLRWSEERCSDGCEDGGTYYVQVYNWFGSEGCYTLHVNGLR